MTPVRFTVYRGTAPTLRFTLAPVVSGGITGWTTKFTARKSVSDADPAPLSVSGTINDATACIVDVPLTRVQTLALVSGAYTVSLQRTNAGLEDMLAIGTMTVELNVLDPKA
jgi:hypothetical protein